MAIIARAVRMPWPISERKAVKVTCPVSSIARWIFGVNAANGAGVAVGGRAVAVGAMVLVGTAVVVGSAVSGGVVLQPGSMIPMMRLVPVAADNLRNCRLDGLVSDLEFRRMFSGEADPNNAYLDIQAGSGGTEAQDWASMLLRMYLRWCEKKGFKVDVVEVSEGEVAGIKSATIHVQGDHAFGWLRTETGVHRLVRKSPFDSGARRHTSFSSVFVSPEIDDNVEIEINPADLRIDTYRASGAGGQHVNRTDSAVRITHEPTGTVVQCQSQRSQHQNKDFAMKQLRAKLYEREMDARRADQQALEDSKADIGWGSQIRSYVLDSSRIKDLRTQVETSNTQAVLDGALDPFIEASLKQGL